MYLFDRTLIAPSPAALEQALAEAAATGNKGLRAKKLVWPPDGLEAFLSRWQADAEGEQQWNGQSSSTAIVWWSDPIGRKHCRIVSKRNTGTSLFQPDTDRYRKGRERPLLWKTYPDDLYIREEGEERRLWAVCRCGAAGPPEKLGWMGPWCAACHDRAVEGQPQSRPGLHRPVVFTGHPFWVDGLAFAPDGRTLLVSVNCHPDVWAWDTVTGRHTKRTFPGRPRNSNINGFTVAARAPRAAICIDGEARTWSLADDGEAVALETRLNDNGSTVVLAFSPDGVLLATASFNDRPYGWRVAIHDASTGRHVRGLPLSGDYPRRVGRNCLAFSPNGRLLALCWRGVMVRLWDTSTWEELPPLPGNSAGEDVSSVAFSPDGKTLAAGHNQAARGELWLWDVPSRKLRGNFKGTVASIAFSPDGKVVATVGDDTCLRLRDASDGRLLAAYRWQQRDLDAVAFSPDGQWLATGGKEPRVKLWPLDGLLRGG
jgi:WD40 repeat protein